jgi:hypothetical protein
VAPKYRFGVFVLFFSLDFFFQKINNTYHKNTLTSATLMDGGTLCVTTHRRPEVRESSRRQSRPQWLAHLPGARQRNASSLICLRALTWTLKHCRSLFVQDARCCSDYPVSDHLLISWNYNNDASAKSSLITAVTLTAIAENSNLHTENEGRLHLMSITIAKQSTGNLRAVLLGPASTGQSNFSRSQVP